MAKHFYGATLDQGQLAGHERMEILFELILEAVLEILCQIGIYTSRDRIDARPSPWLLGLVYSVMGALAGCLSLQLFPQLFLSSDSGKWLNLLFAPVVAGGIMSCIGEWRRPHDRPVVGLETFVYGYLFALSLALVRFVWAN